MIFGAKNEENRSTCDLVLSGEKIITRRPETGRSYHLGRCYAVQRGRGKPSKGRIRIVSIFYHREWIVNVLKKRNAKEKKRILKQEAKREGFLSWNGLLEYMEKNNVDINHTIRYRFKLQKK